MTKMSEIVCEVEGCGRGPATTGDAVYRANPTGEKGRWRCRLHASSAQVAAISPVEKLLERDMKGRRGTR